MGCLFSIFRSKNNIKPIISPRNKVYHVINRPRFSEEEIMPPGYNEVDDYYDDLNRPYSFSSFSILRRHSLDNDWD